MFNQIRLVVRPESFGVGGTDNIQLRVSGIDVETSFVEAVEQFTTPPLVSIISYDSLPNNFDDGVYAIIPNLGESQNAEPYTAVNVMIGADTIPLGAIRLQPGFLYVYEYSATRLSSTTSSNVVQIRTNPVGGAAIPIENWQSSSIRSSTNSDNASTLHAIIDPALY